MLNKKKILQIAGIIIAILFVFLIFVTPGYQLLKR